MIMIKCIIKKCEEEAGGKVIKQGGLVGNMILCDRHFLESKKKK